MGQDAPLAWPQGPAYSARQRQRSSPDILPWCAEMFGYSLAAAQLGLWHVAFPGVQWIPGFSDELTGAAAALPVAGSGMGQAEKVLSTPVVAVGSTRLFALCTASLSIQLEKKAGWGESGCPSSQSSLLTLCAQGCRINCRQPAV